MAWRVDVTCEATGLAYEKGFIATCHKVKDVDTGKPPGVSSWSWVVDEGFNIFVGGQCITGP